VKPTAAIAIALLAAAGANAYPLDGYPTTGIARLEAFDLARESLLARGDLKPGSLRRTDEVRLRLTDRPDFRLPPSDPDLSQRLRDLLGADAPAYGIAVLDLSDPAQPRYVELNGSRIQNPGSVGKILVALAWFQAMADIYPDDLQARERLLYETVITADGFIRTDGHTVPFYRPGDAAVRRRPIQEGDIANLWTYFDWMLSASSNAAASTIMKQLILLVHFGAEYPVSRERADAFLADTPPKELSKLYLDAMLGPLARNGLDADALRQGSFFTREGKRRVPGTNSVATARELMKYAVFMEQGKLVDPWSSLQIKRLLYLTDIRIRYASQPALDGSAVYYKSGSLYGCQPEPGFECGKYMGNRMNYMNSLAIVETEEGGRSLDYIVVVLSNVLRKNSAEEHRDLARRIHGLIESFHPPAPAGAPEAGAARP
jgi:hypothetical protein